MTSYLNGGDRRCFLLLLLLRGAQANSIKISYSSSVTRR